MGPYSWVSDEGIHFSRTGGQHGTGPVGVMMGTVLGSVMEAKQEGLYIAGDIIWCNEVREALIRYQPDTVVVNAGAACVVIGDPITMMAAEALQTARYAPQAIVYAVHLEAVNHASENRTLVRALAAQEGLSDQAFALRQ